MTDENGEVTRRLIALIFGGQSPEHEVSIQSAARVARGLEKLPGVRAVPVYISKPGKWHWSRPAEGMDAGSLVMAAGEADTFARHYQPGGLDFPQALLHLNIDEVTANFVIVHGPDGEDGRLQGAFELAGMAYCGSGPAASSLALDKPRSQALLAQRGVPVPKFRALAREDVGDPNAIMALIDAIGFPCVVKPGSAGSSVGVQMVPDGDALEGALRDAFKHGTVAHVEQFIAGREFTCTVLDREEGPEAMPVLEIVPPEGRMFDYDAKYVAGASQEICPASIDDELRDEIQGLSVRVHREVGAEGFSRVDFMLSEEGPLVLEINTLPGMTATSLLPQAVRAAGMEFEEFLELAIGQAVRRAEAARRASLMFG